MCYLKKKCDGSFLHLEVNLNGSLHGLLLDWASQGAERGADN